jgi:DNA-binding SARP family transcriptional activator
MRILVLGSVQVVASGQERPLSAAKHRGLLAMLAMHLGQLVSLESIIECLWDGTPPVTAANLVRQYVSFLRREALAGLADVELTTRPSGYCLQAARDEVDVFRLEQQLERGTAQLAGGNGQDAIVTASEALALVRGPALTDVPASPALIAERDRIAELVISAEELQVAAFLACGRTPEATVKLKRMIAMHPFNERLHAHLMRALSLSGRSADALDVYRSARRTMVAELGVEPGEEMRRLEREILAGSVEGACRPTASQSAGPPPVSPSDGALYVGRDDEFSMAVAALTDPVEAAGGLDPLPLSRLLVVNGPAGIGKTALAVRLMHSVRDSFEDGRLFVDLCPSGPLTAAEGLEQILCALGVSGVPDKVAAQQWAIAESLAGRRVLLVLDNAVNEAQVRPLLLTEPGCATVVTSRNQVSGICAGDMLSLGTLDDRSAWALFVRLLGPGRIGDEEHEARAIVEMCGGLPIAIQAAATRLRNLRHRSLAEFAHRMRGERMLDELAVGDLNVRRRMESLYRQLDSDSRQVLHHLAGLPLRPRQPLRLSWLAGELGVADVVLDRMVEAGALEPQTGHGSLYCLELLRRYAQVTELSTDARGPGSADVARLPEPMSENVFIDRAKRSLAS